MNRKARVRLALALAVTLVFLWLFLRGLHWREVGEALAGVRPAWIALAVTFALSDYGVRAVRWLVLFRHIDATVPLETLWRGTAIGAALNTVLPLRGGDLVRPAYVANRRAVPFTTVLSTTVVERLLDMVGGVVALLVLAVLLPSDLAAGPETLARLQRWGIGAAITALIGLGVVSLLATRRAREIAMLLTRPWPGPVRMRMMRLYLQLALGLEVGGQPARLVAGLGLTALLWAVTAGMGWAVFHALGVDAPPLLGLFLAVAITAAVAVPQAPGFLGVFQVVAAQAALLWGVSAAVSEASAIALWVVYVLPITAIGLGYGVVEGRGLLGYARVIEEKAASVAVEP